jgi:hypothetical protein
LYFPKRKVKKFYLEFGAIGMKDSRNLGISGNEEAISYTLNIHAQTTLVLVPSRETDVRQALSGYVVGRS